MSRRATSSVLRGIWESAYGLLVDDGQLAVGAIAALAITWLVASFGGDAVQQNAGWLLLALVLALVVSNLYLAGHKVRSRIS